MLTPCDAACDCTCDSRRFPRADFFAAVTVATASGPIDARSCNISLGGICLCSPSPLPVGDPVRLTIRLPPRHGGAAEQVQGRVAYVRIDDDGAVMGVEFTPALDRKLAPGLVRAIGRL